MLDQLMLILNRGGAITIDQIAREMNTTPEMITQLIEYLERNGLLQQLGGDCQITCDGCYLAQTCTGSQVRRIWSSAN